MGLKGLSLFNFSSLPLGRTSFTSRIRSFVWRSGICVFVAGNSIGAIRIGEYFNNFMPRWHSAVAINDPFNPNGYILNDWGKFLVDSYAPFNQMWWKWSYDRLRSDPMVVQGLSSTFAQVTKPFSPQWVWYDGQLMSDDKSSDELSLNNVCYNLSVYRTYELKGDELRDFWTFCSAGGGEIVYLQIPRSELDLNHPLANELKSFVDSESPSNDWFWQIRQIEFEMGSLPFVQFFYWHPSKSVRVMCRDIYKSWSNEVMKTAINALSADKYGVLRFCGLATLPEGLERTVESYAYEEILYGYRNSRAPSMD